MVRGLQCRDIAPANITRGLQIGASPCEALAAEPHDEKVGHQTGMTAIPVREGMNLHKAVMEAHGDFIGWIGLVFDPRSSIVEQLMQGGGNFIEGYPKIAFARTQLPGPSPNVAEHPLVQIRHKFLAQGIAASAERPVLRAQDVLLLGFIQLAAIRDVRGNQLALFLGRQRRCIIGLVENVSHF